MMAERTCQYCGDNVTSRDPDVMTCRECWYNGREHADTFSALLSSLSAIDGVTSADVWHTGGGCFGIMVDHPEWFAFLTEAYVRDDGTFECDAFLPSDNSHCLLGIGLYASHDAFRDSEEPVNMAYASGPTAVTESLRAMMDG